MNDFFNARVDGSTLGKVRIAIGLLAALKATRSWYWVGPDLPSTELLRAPYWSSIPLVRPGIVIGLMFVAALFLAAGLFTRWSGSALVLAICYWMAMDRQLYANHLYLLALLVLLLTLADSGAALSLDATRRGSAGTVPLWGVTLIKLQISIVYAFAALAKLNADYLSGQVIAQSTGRSVALSQALAMGALLTEAWLAVGLWLPRWRSATMGLGIAFHLGIAVAMVPHADLAIFGGLMIATYPLFAAYQQRPFARLEPAPLVT